MSSTTQVRRPENLALIFQEILTATVRLRASRQEVSDPIAFRHHMREALRTAAGQALAAGYPSGDVKLATFATVAFLDESVLNSQNPIFADWLSKPLQEELFGTHVAGELFFQNLQQILSGSDSADQADLLEVYYLCLLLGFGGRYSAGSRGDLTRMMDRTAEKIRRVRGPFSGLSPAWARPDGARRSARDPWLRRLGWIAASCALLAVLLFAGFKAGLLSDISDLHALATQAH